MAVPVPPSNMLENPNQMLLQCSVQPDPQPRPGQSTDAHNETTPTADPLSELLDLLLLELLPQWPLYCGCCMGPGKSMNFASFACANSVEVALCYSQ